MYIIECRSMSAFNNKRGFYDPIAIYTSNTKKDISSRIFRKPKQRLPRRNFSEEEDEQLCRSFLFVVFNKGAEDGKNSPEEENESLWSRIEDHFKEALGESYIPRNDRSLPSRWQIINKAVSRYKGILSQSEKKNVFNINNEDIESEAKKIYKSEMKSKFNLMHCYAVLNRNLQWQEQQEKKNMKIKSNTIENSGEKLNSAVESYQQEGNEKDNSSIFITNTEIESITIPTSSRRKRKDYIDMIIEKRKERRFCEYNKTIEAKRKAALASEALAKARIMSINTEAITDFSRRKWVENMQQKILSYHFDFN